MAIQFGTDGWRAIIGESYTYQNVRRVVQAFCDLNRKNRHLAVVLGYDRRFCSRQFAEASAEVLLGNGFVVYLSESFCPTPGVSWMTKHKKALAGIVITASHNPFHWNGIKFKESDGGSASPQYTSRIEKQILKNDQQQKQPKRLSLEVGKKQKQLKSFDPHQAYLKQLGKMIDLNKIRRSKIKVVADALYGSGSGFFSALLGNQVIPIRDEENPSFGGINPEPIAKNLQATSKAVLKNRAQIGLATDGDADRIGAVDEKGNFVNAHQIFSLILRHLISVKGLKGDVIKTVSTTQMVNRLSEHYGLNLIETPIGFKHICEQFRRTSPLMGGEESGGIGVARHVFERDGILCGLLLLEILAHHKQPFSKVIQELQNTMGPFYYKREDIALSDKQKQKLNKVLSNGFVPKMTGLKIKQRSNQDGYKFIFEDCGWLLIRPSGTEPLLRVYAETSQLKKTDQLIKSVTTNLMNKIG